MVISVCIIYYCSHRFSSVSLRIMLCSLNTFHVNIRPSSEYVIGENGVKPISRVEATLSTACCLLYIDTCCLAICYTSHVEGLLGKISEKIEWLLDLSYPRHITGRQAMTRVEKKHL